MSQYRFLMIRHSSNATALKCLLVMLVKPVAAWSSRLDVHRMLHPLTLKLILCLCTTVAAIELTACASISPYNEKAYENATSLKAESLTLLGKAGDDYSLHQKDVDTLELDANKANEYAKGLSQNTLVVEQYAIVLNEHGGLLYGALNKWKAKRRLNEIEISEFSTQLGKEFDQIIALEQGKNKL